MLAITRILFFGEIKFNKKRMTLNSRKTANKAPKCWKKLDTAKQYGTETATLNVIRTALAMQSLLVWLVKRRTKLPISTVETPRL